MMIMMMMSRPMIIATLAHFLDTDCDCTWSENYPEYSKFKLRDNSFPHFSQVLLNNIDPSVCGYSVRFWAHPTINGQVKERLNFFRINNNDIS